MPKRLFIENLKLFFKVVIVSFVFAFIFWFLFLSSFFELKTIDIQIKNEVSLPNSSELELKNYILANISSRNIFFINTPDLETALFENSVYMKEINVQKDFPNRLIVDISERTPYIAFFDYVSENIKHIDKEGYILTSTKYNDPINNELIFIYSSTEFSIGERISETLLTNLRYLNHFIPKSIIDVQIYLDEKYIEFAYLPSGFKKSVKVIMPYKKFAGPAFSKELNIVDDLIFQGENFPKKIDLRYDKVVVSY
jgi:hypothetical protein